MLQKMRWGTLLAVAMVVTSGRAEAGHDWRLGVGVVRQAGGGLRIQRVFEGSPAEGIGLKPRDVIVSVDGQMANDARSLRQYIDGTDRIRMVYERDHQCFEVEVDLEEMVLDGRSYGAKVKSVSKAKRVPDPRRNNRGGRGRPNDRNSRSSRP